MFGGSSETPKMSSDMPQLDIVIPVYNEGANILRTLQGLADRVQSCYRVLICYDFEEDDTLSAIGKHGGFANLPFVRKPGPGAPHAIITGFHPSKGPFLLLYPPHRTHNARISAP